LDLAGCRSSWSISRLHLIVIFIMIDVDRTLTISVPDTNSQSNTRADRAAQPGDMPGAWARSRRGPLHVLDVRVIDT
jgi:hypothetical protein